MSTLPAGAAAVAGAAVAGAAVVGSSAAGRQDHGSCDKDGYQNVQLLFHYISSPQMILVEGLDRIEQFNLIFVYLFQCITSFQQRKL